MTFLISIIPGWLKAALAGIAALALAMFGMRRAGKREGRLEAKAKAAEDAVKRSNAGRAAAEKAKGQIAAGKDPNEMVKGRDAKWQ